MIYRQIVKKGFDGEICEDYYEKRAYLGILQKLELDKSYNIQTSRVKLTPQEVDEVAQNYKRADGQYVYCGSFISLEEISRKIYQNCYVFQIEAVEIENMRVNNIIKNIDILITQEKIVTVEEK